MTTGQWTICHNEGERHVALQLCRGEYQRGLVLGTHNLSASTATCRFRGTYRRSALELMKRMREHGLTVAEQRGPRNARILVIGQVPGDSR